MVAVSCGEQKNFDNDLVFSGFLNISGHCEVTEICQYYYYPRENVHHVESFKMGNRNQNTSHQAQTNQIKCILRYRNSFDKINFVMTRKNTGPFMSNFLEGNLVGEPNSSYSDETKAQSTTITNRYTPTLKKINWILSQLIKTNHISTIKYIISFFLYQDV